MVCYVCMKRSGEGEGGRLLTCAGCKQLRYCGKACQKRHWKEEHKELCGILAHNMSRESRFPQAALFQKYSKEWVTRASVLNETYLLATLLVPSPEDVFETGVTFVVCWNPSAPDGSKLVLDRRAMASEIGGPKVSPLLAGSKSFQMAHRNRARITNESHVGVLFNVLFNTWNPANLLAPSLDGAATVQHIAFPIPRTAWDTGDTKKLPVNWITIAILTNRINAMCGKELHMKRYGD